MNIIDRLFRGGTVEATTERTEAELQRQLAEVEIALAAGEGDIIGMLEERESIGREIEAARIARERAETMAYRARATDQANELRGRLNESLAELGDLVPRLLVACAHFNAIAEEVQVKGLGTNPGAQLLEDIYCIPPTFGRDLSQAINTLAPRTEWDYGHIGILGKGVKAEQPKLKGPTQMRVPRFAGDLARTYDANKGPWPPEKAIGGEGTSGTFLPF